MISIKECGVFVFKLYDQEGNLLEEKRASNMLTSEGSARMLNLSFNSSATGGQTSYVGLIDNSGYLRIDTEYETKETRILIRICFHKVSRFTKLKHEQYRL